MEISVLASGSKGNSTYVGTEENSFLIDAGISARQIKKRLSSIGKEIEDIDAVFVTHEHSDHIRGLERLNKSFNRKIYINKKAYRKSNLKLESPYFFNDKIKLNDVRINPVKVSHDCVQPYGFFIEHKKKKVGIFTDLGEVNEELKNITNKADALVIESNHDVDMLLNGPYPYHLKERILSSRGHLSNIDAGLLVQEHGSENLKAVFLSHLSKKNNTEELAMNTFSELTIKKRLKKYITKQEKSTELIRI